MFEKFIYNIINTTVFFCFFLNILIASSTSSRENDQLIGSFSRIMTGLYSRRTLPENRGSLFCSGKLSTNSTNSVALNCALVLVPVLIILPNSLGF